MQGTFKEHAEIAKEVATAAPYKEWVNSNHRLEELVSTNQYLQETQMDSLQVLRLQAANGEPTESLMVINVICHEALGHCTLQIIFHPAGSFVDLVILLHIFKSRSSLLIWSTLCCVHAAQKPILCQCLVQAALASELWPR